jgi:hypothetical protein
MRERRPGPPAAVQLLPSKAQPTTLPPTTWVARPTPDALLANSRSVGDVVADSAPWASRALTQLVVVTWVVVRAGGTCVRGVGRRQDLTHFRDA